MARLSRPPALLAAAPRLIGYADKAAAERDRDRRRMAENAARRLYNTARWRALRLEVLDRDGWLCRQTGVLLVPGRVADHSAVVDHIEPHRGNLALFWDPANLQSVAKSWHDSDKNRQDRRRGGARSQRSASRCRRTHFAPTRRRRICT